MTDEKMREALEPFAALGGPNDGVMPAYHDLYDDVVVYANSGRGITAGDVRRARAVLGIMHAPRKSDLSPEPLGGMEALRKTANALENLHAMVWGECPSLLNEDSGGSAHLDMEIKEALELATATLSTKQEGEGVGIRETVRLAVRDKWRDGCARVCKIEQPDKLSNICACDEMARLVADTLGKDQEAGHSIPDTTINAALPFKSCRAI